MYIYICIYIYILQAPLEVAAHEEQSGAITLGVDLGVCQGNEVVEVSHDRTITKVQIPTFPLAGFLVDAR